METLLTINGQAIGVEATIGIETIKLCINANLKGIFLKKNKNIFLNKEKAINLANKNNFFISAI